jgi:molybdopterin molybdotransferase
MLQAMLAAFGITETSAYHCADDLETTTAMLRDLISSQDIILLSGGVSVGDHDHVKPALARLGITPDLWRVRVKPGKPFLFAQANRSEGGQLVSLFGLPGNPVSAYVTFQLFVRPALLRWLGATVLDMPSFPARTHTALHHDGDRPHYLRGSLRDGIFHPAHLQQSHALYALSQSTALLRLEPGVSFPAGAQVTVLLPG